MKRVLVVPLVAVLVLALGGCNWLKSLGKKDNVEPPTPLTEIVPTVAVTPLWTAGGSGGAGDSGARIAPGTGDGRVYAAGVDGTVEALDAASGNTIWSRHLGTRHGWLWRRGENSRRWAGGPAVAGDLLVVGGLDGHVLAMSTVDGKDLWQATVSSEVIVPPVIVGGLVVVRSFDGRLTALDSATGDRKWIFDQPVPALSLRGDSAPVSSLGAVFDGFDNGKIFAVRLDDGNALWSQTLSSGEGRTEVERLSDVDGKLVIDGSDLIAVGYHGQLASFALGSGQPQWQRDLSAYGGAAVDDNVVVVADADGNVWGFDRATGANLWKQDALKYRWLTTPAVVGHFAVVGDVEGYVHWIDTGEGKIAARERLSSKPIEATPVVSGDTVYVEDVKGRIGAYRTGS